MKKIILAAVAVFAFSSANAQDKISSEGFSEGDVYLTGDFNFYNQKQGDAKVDGLTISPGIGYFLTEKLALVGSLTYTSATSVTDAKTTGVGVSAGVKYFWTPASKFSISLGGEFSYLTEKYEPADVKVNTIGLNVPLGLNYFISDRFALTSTWGGIGYSSAKADTSGAEAVNTIGLGLGLSDISFGLLFKL